MSRYTYGPIERRILRAIAEADGWITASEIAAATGDSPVSISSALWRLTHKLGGPYRTEGNTRGRRYRSTAATGEALARLEARQPATSPRARLAAAYAGTDPDNHDPNDQGETAMSTLRTMSDGFSKSAGSAERLEERRESAAARFRKNADYEDMLALKESDPATFEELMRGRPSLRIGLGMYERDKAAALAEEGK